jgi:hypothetical protein
MISCSDGGSSGGKKPPTDKLTKVDLGAYNTWGGSKSAQQGWATAGFQWNDDSVTPNEWKTVDDKGYKLDDFQKAVYLVLEVADGQPEGGIDLIWGGNDNTTTDGKIGGLGAWNSTAIFSSTGNPASSKGVEKEGNKITIQLNKALANYDKYIGETATAVRLVIAYYGTGSGGLAELGITAAYLLVSDDEPELPELPDEENWPTVDGEYEVLVELGNTATSTNNAQQKGWLIGDYMDEIAEADYFVLMLEGIGGNKDGFGGIKIIYQGDDAPDNPTINIGWTSITIVDGWKSYDRTDDGKYCIAIALKEFLGEDYDDFLQCANWARILIEYYMKPSGSEENGDAFEMLGIVDAAFVKNLEKPKNAVTLVPDLAFVFEDRNSLYADGFKPLGDFNQGENTWTGITVAEMEAADYLILEVDSIGEDGLGGVQIATNGTGGWKDQVISADWSEGAMKDSEPNGWLKYDEDIIYYIVIDLSATPLKAIIDANFYTGGSYRHLVVNGTGGTKVVNGYLVSGVTLTKPTDKFYDLEKDGVTYGWAAPDVPEGKD